MLATSQISAPAPLLPLQLGPRVVRCTDARRFDASVLGGKGAQLAVLGALGAPVPPWLCLTTDACDAVLNGSGELDPGDVRALLEACDALFPGGGLLAVRSSAEAEDSSQSSFAGQLESYLNTPREELVARVIDCILSARSERVALYRKARKLGDAPLRTAVIVQQMVDSRAAGVLFTANPTRGDLSEAVIAAGLGLGEGVVCGKVESDTVYAELATGEIRAQEIAHKRGQVVRDPRGQRGTAIEPVPESLALQPVLSAREVAELVALGRRIAEARRCPQDIEWAVDGQGRLFALQARPITTLPAPAATGRETIFDNANIVESYPGLSSPLTFSFVRAAYAHTFRAAAGLVGIPEASVHANADLFENLVGLVDGRIYYNILNWYRLYQLVPGFESLLPAWEKALGLSHLPARPAAPPLGIGGRLRALGERSRVAWRLLSQGQTLSADVSAALKTLDEVQRESRATDLGALDAHALLELFERLGQRVYSPFALALVNDLFAQQLYALAGKMMARWGLGDPAAGRNELFRGDTGLDSVAPVRSLLRTAALVRQLPPLRALMEGTASSEEVWRQIQEDPRFAAVRTSLAEHLQRFGDRTLHELKLETPPLEEDPLLAVALLRNAMRQEQDMESLEARERHLREEAEARVLSRLQGRPLRRAAFLWVLERARRSIRYRESLRLARSRSFGVVKRIFRELGRKLAAAGLLDTPGDVFFLTVEEVAGAVRGHSVTQDLRALVRLRREEQARHAEHEDLPTRVTTQGIVLARAPLAAASKASLPTGRSLQGVGCSPGRVRGRARRVLDPRREVDVRGEILVAPMTDPGWVFLMVSAAGIISERGSPLSHTAIIGRELGIPTVVGVADATRRIASGDLIELDGATGTVELVEEAP